MTMNLRYIPKDILLYITKYMYPRDLVHLQTLFFCNLFYIHFFMVSSILHSLLIASENIRSYNIPEHLSL